MALPGVPQTFAVEDARDLANKLWWEIEAFRKEECLDHKLWRAFNCAVTAWHITDWLWKERCTDGQNVGKLRQFQKAIQDQCKELRLCKHIANASKHGGVDPDRGYDAAIQVIVRWAKETPVAFKDIEQSQHWEIMISDHGHECDALHVFYKALEFWEREVRRPELTPPSHDI
jgi:hypothetical protein